MNTEELVALCPLFRGILPEELHALLHCLSAQELSPPKGGFILASPGTQPLIGVVLEGSVQMISEDSFGKRSLIMVLSKGSIFGESYSCMKARNRSIAYQAYLRSEERFTGMPRPISYAVFCLKKNKY